MTTVNLGPRLRRVAEYVPQDAVAVDVGTDHAYVPIWLLQSGRCRRAYATDNKPGPLENAAADAKYGGVADRLTLYLCDGLAAVTPESVDAVILAGMGGETIQQILEAAPWALEKRLILQPQTKMAELRRWLAENGVAVIDAALAHDNGRVYLIWLAERGTPEDPDFPVDAALLRNRDPLLRPYIAERVKRLRKQLMGLSRAKETDETLLRARNAELAELERLYREVSEWQAQA